VKIDEPASVSEAVMPRSLNGQSTRVNPARKMPSQITSCATRIAAALVARILSRLS